MPHLAPALRLHTLFGQGKHLGALLKGQHAAGGPHRLQQRGITQARAGAHVQHHLAGLQLQQRDGAQTQRHGAAGRCVVARGMVAVALDGHLLGREHGALSNQGVARDARCMPATPNTIRPALANLRPVAGSLNQAQPMRPVARVPAPDHTA